MAYPDYYKVSEMSITKFERNISGEQLKYTFINAFPKGMTAIPVAYGAADLLKVTVSFNYDRYVMEQRICSSTTKPTLNGSIRDSNPNSNPAGKTPKVVISSKTIINNHN